MTSYSVLRWRHVRLPLCAALAAVLFGSGVQAGSVSPGIVIGVFSGPILAGNVANDPSLGQLTYLDNSATAVHAINNSTTTTLTGNPPLQSTGSALTWGANSPATNQSFSVLTFFGATIPADPTIPFKIGTVTFENGTSSLNSLILGATLSFYDNSVAAQNFLGSDQVTITTTSNLGASPQQDADYINICGNRSNICATSIEAVEETQGGTGVTANLFGTITGDPVLTLTGATLAPGQSTTTNGFLGHDLPLAAVPERASLGIVSCCLLMLAGIGTMAKRRRLPR